MKSKLVLGAVACTMAFAAGTALGQDAQSKEMTYTGCIKADQQAGTYMLTHVMAGKPGQAQESAEHGNAPEMLELTSESVPLAQMNGHKVMVMGETMKDGSHMKMMVKSLESLDGMCE
jgi:hypothetical protein